MHSPNCSIEKAHSRLGYEPRYGSLDAVRESVGWLMEHGIVRAPAGHGFPRVEPQHALFNVQ